MTEAETISSGGRAEICRSADASDLAIVTSWIDNEKDCRTWAGPAVSFPISVQMLKTQIGYRSDNSYCLMDEGRLTAFGQLLKKDPQRFHLARIIVAPAQRGKGYGRHICRCLINRANHLGARVLTLNVYQQNKSALELYRYIGFAPAVPTSGERLPADIVHMKYKLPEPTKAIAPLENR
jgi:ribosomal protein S18 acetylase RimI-like enzyme